MKVWGHDVSDVVLGRAIEDCAVAGPFRASDVEKRVRRELGFPPEVHTYSEAVNRMLQAARKAGEIYYDKGRWHDASTRQR